jgi:hypothetical protein
MAAVATVSQSGGVQLVQIIAAQASGDQTSTNSYVAHAGTVLDALYASFVSMTIKVATNAVKWTVYGANQSDFSDKVEVQAEAVVNAAAVGSYSTAAAVWRYYRAEIASNVAETHGVVTAAAIAK